MIVATYLFRNSGWNTKKEVTQLTLFAAAFSWTLTNYFKYNQNRIRYVLNNYMYVDVFIFGCFFRQEVVVQDQGDSLAAPFLTFCPIFTDSLVFPAKGFENKDLTFEKYTLMQERNFLLKNYSYSGYGCS